MTTAEDLYQALNEMPLIDIHTHLVGGKLGARGLHDILLYHMAVSDLYAAGCPSGARLTEYPGWADEAEAARRIEEALPFLEQARNTSTSWGVQIILRELYDWREPLTRDNWKRLDARIRAHADDRGRHREILHDLHIRRVGTEWARREEGQDDDILQYALEWAFFTRCQWGEYDTALWELERCWGKQPGPATPIGAGKRPLVERAIKTLEDVHAAVAHYVSALPAQVLSIATHLSTDLDFHLVTDTEMEAALGRRAAAGEAERSTYASYANELFLRLLAERRPGVIFQFSTGAEPLPFETGSRISQTTIRQLGELFSRHPKIHFQCFLASRHANQSFCTLCRELPNLSLTGYWWHNFFPGTIQQVLEERLDMLPLNKQVGFFSDAYCIEWSYAKLQIVRRCMANVLAQKVSLRQYTTEEALSIAQDILFKTPQTLNGFVPAQ